MYCPKCGTDNTATNIYCRACREELSLVAQAMNKSLPVKLAGKLDAIFDSKAERFRRESLALFLLGSVALCVAHPGNSVFWQALTVIAFYAGSLWEYLAFMRSRALRKELDSLVSTSGDSPDWLTTLSLSGRDKAGPERRIEAAKIESPRYCPRCGTGGQGRSRFCPGCGTDLWAMRRALGKGLRQSWLGKRIDAYVRRQSADETIDSNAQRRLLAGPLMMLISIWFGPAPVSWSRALPLEAVYLALGALMTFSGLWDHLVYRRRLERPLPPAMTAQAGSPTEENTALWSPHQVQVPESGPETSPFTIVDEPTQKMGPDRSQNT